MALNNLNQAWIWEHKSVWRAAALWLLALAFLGPWVYDRIHVPAQYPCRFPNIRLEGDFCGVPSSGLYMIWAIVSELSRRIAGLTVGLTGLAEVVTSLRFLLLTPLLLLPFLSNMLVILIRGRQPWRWFSAAVWGLAVVAGLLIGLAIHPTIRPALWGIWLYLGVSLGAFLLELWTRPAGLGRR